MSRFNIKAGYFSEQRSGPGLVIVERIDIYDSHRMENVSKLKQTEAKHRVSQHNSAVCPTCYQFTALASQPSFWTHKVLCYSWSRSTCMAKLFSPCFVQCWWCVSKQKFKGCAIWPAAVFLISEWEYLVGPWKDFGELSFFPQLRTRSGHRWGC